MKQINRWLCNSLIILSVAGLVACSTQKDTDKYEDKTIQKANTVYDKNRIKKPTSLVTKSDEMFLSDEHFVITSKQKLPSVFV